MQNSLSPLLFSCHLLYFLKIYIISTLYLLPHIPTIPFLHGIIISWKKNKLGKWYIFFIPPIILIPDIVFIRIQMKVWSCPCLFVGVSHGGLYYKWSITDAIHIAVFKHIRTIHSLRKNYLSVFLQVLGFTLWSFFSMLAIS